MEESTARAQHPLLWGADVGIVAVGQNAIGIVAAGLYNSFGIAALSLLNAMGLGSFGPINSMGLVAIGGVNAVGLVAIGGVNAVGVVAIAGSTPPGSSPSAAERATARCHCRSARSTPLRNSGSLPEPQTAA